MTPVQRRAAVRGVRPEGAYHRLVLDAPVVAGSALPGQFVALAVGEEPTAMLLRRCFSIAAARDGGVELLVAAAGPGSTWLTRRRPGDQVDLVGPLGRPFPAPAGAAAQPTGCVLVAGGYGAAPILWWARDLIAAGHRVALVLGAADAARLAQVEAARALGGPVFVTTDDGSAGIRGRVTDVLPEALESVAAHAGSSSSRTPPSSASPVQVYGCGPMAMLRAVSEVGADSGARVWCAVEEAMACGVGVCMTCVLPVRGEDGVTRMVRSCVEGPTFAGDAVCWEAISTTPSLLGAAKVGAAVPADCLGAPR